MSIITIPGNVKTIGKGAFLYNHATEIYVLDGVEDIGEGAFENCYFLTKIEIPASVKKIGKLAFYGDGTLSTNCQIYYAGTEHYFKKIGGNAEGSTLIALVTGFTVKALYTDGTPVDGTLGWDGEKTSNVNVVFTEVKNQGLHPVINSQVIQKYDKNQAIYNESTSSWEIHTATDYSAELGQNVFAVDYGTIVNIYNELLWGDIIVLETVGNLTIYYKGVMANSNVLVGSEVVKGQVIGTVSSNGAHEGYLGTHIHVEVSTKEGSVDLEKYLILGDSYKAVSLNSEGTCLYLDPCSAVAEKYKVTIENLPVGYTADEIYVDYTNYEIIFVVKET